MLHQSSFSLLVHTSRTASQMIRISRIGTTRLVLVIGPWAIKVGRDPRGRRCNQHEADLFASVDDRRRAMLCPARWCSSGGRLLVMAAATPLTEPEKEELIDSNGFPDWDYMPGEESEPSNTRPPTGDGSTAGWSPSIIRPGRTTVRKSLRS